MSFIDCLSLTTLAIIATSFVIGYHKDRGTQEVATVLFVGWLLVHAAFQAGAAWQREDFKSKPSAAQHP